MITNRINALFQFIDFLHSNIDNFKQYDNRIEELHLLNEKRSELEPQKNFAHKLEFDKIQEEIKAKFRPIEKKIIQPIKAKAIELNIYDPNDFKSHYSGKPTKRYLKIMKRINEINRISDFDIKSIF